MDTGPINVTLEQAAGAMELADVFGTRPPTGKPHSINLQGTAAQPTPLGAARGVDLLLGVWVGAAAMYYFDPDRGARRRALVRDGIVRLVTTTASDPFTGERTQEVSASPAHRAAVALSSGRAPRNEWPPADRVVAGVIGGALALFAAGRRDVLGAAAGLVGSALLARGVVSVRPAHPERGSEMDHKPITSKLGNTIQGSGFLEKM